MQRWLRSRLRGCAMRRYSHINRQSLRLALRVTSLYTREAIYNKTSVGSGERFRRKRNPAVAPPLFWWLHLGEGSLHACFAIPAKAGENKRISEDAEKNQRKNEEKSVFLGVFTRKLRNTPESIDLFSNYVIVESIFWHLQNYQCAANYHHTNHSS